MYSVATPIDTEENALAKRVLSHWQQEFGSITVLDEPFQHFYSDCVWPGDVYPEMLRLLPPHDVYKPMNIKEWVNAEGVSTRDRCFLPEILNRLDQERASFWRQIWLALTSESLKCLLFNRFKKDIADMGQVLGVSMLGAQAGEVIHEAAMGMRFRATVDDFFDLLHVYPTMAESLKIVAISRHKDPSKLSCCAE